MPNRLLELWLDYKISLLLGSISICFILLGAFLFVQSIRVADESIEFVTHEASASGTQLSMIVDISGAVKNPGVYALPMGSRVEDAIQKAGGFSANVDEKSVAKIINRASLLKDGVKIYIPEVREGVSDNNVVQYTDTVTSHIDSSVISINYASQSELESLSGVGPATATKIIAGRPYQSLEELVTKKAMGQSLFEKLQNSLSL